MGRRTDQRYNMNKPHEPKVSGRGASEWGAAGKRLDEKLACKW